jgi:hypothetical protein
MHYVLIVGSNPSKGSIELSAFHGSTRSRKFLDSLFIDKKYNIKYMNILDIKTENNKPLSMKDIKSNISSIRDKFLDHAPYKVVSFGSIASKTLSMLNVQHYSMPHPSGRCRVWNDKRLANELTSGMFKWIENG